MQSIEDLKKYIDYSRDLDLKQNVKYSKVPTALKARFEMHLFHLISAHSLKVSDYTTGKIRDKKILRRVVSMLKEAFSNVWYLLDLADIDIYLLEFDIKPKDTIYPEGSLDKLLRLKDNLSHFIDPIDPKKRIKEIALKDYTPTTLKELVTELVTWIINVYVGTIIHYAYLNKVDWINQWEEILSQSPKRKSHRIIDFRKNIIPKVVKVQTDTKYYEPVKNNFNKPKVVNDIRKKFGKLN